MLLPGGWGGTSSQSRELRGESRYGGKSMRGGLNPHSFSLGGAGGPPSYFFF